MKRFIVLALQAYRAFTALRNRLEGDVQLMHQLGEHVWQYEKKTSTESSLPCAL